MGKILMLFLQRALTTVGYGRVAPVGIPASAIAAVESLVGLLGFALATGLLYGRFSRPRAKIVHSKNMIMAPYKEGVGLMFRIANGRKTQLIDVEVLVTLSRIEIEGGKEIRRFYPLELERSRIAMFPMAWTIVHPVSEGSPLHAKTQHDLQRRHGDLVSLKLMTTFSTVHTACHINPMILYGSKSRHDV